MLLGLDVGGTHTDAVIIDNSGIIASYKAPTQHDDLLKSMFEALENVTKNIDKTKIEKVNLSTTLSTNAIIEKKTEPVGVLVSAGPGINPDALNIGEYYSILSGSIDHRGSVIMDPDEMEIETAINECKKKNINSYAIVTKFSTRNPIQEKHIGSYITRANSDNSFITYGHTLSGQLSFPRRIATAYYNSAVSGVFNNFIDSITASLNELGINAEIHILKADGGTMPINIASEKPVESILSGPAASIMGIISLCHIEEDSILLDIGGTTTDIAIFAAGAPLIERDGIALSNHPTLVRSLKNRSIGIGGDSVLKINDNHISVGPEREGTSMADGGTTPTLIDALNVKGISTYKDTQKSIVGLKELADRCQKSSIELADEAIEYATNRIKEEADSMLTEINEKPVYTIHEMLEGKKVIPKKMYIIGGPAESLKSSLSKIFGLEVVIPKNFEVANAIGAALSRITIEIELFADTNQGKLTIPAIGIEESIGSNYSLSKAKSDVTQYLSQYLKNKDISISLSDAEIIESSSFNMVAGFYSSGKDIRVKCQIKPGVTMEIHNL